VGHHRSGLTFANATLPSKRYELRSRYFIDTVEPGFRLDLAASARSQVESGL